MKKHYITFFAMVLMSAITAFSQSPNQFKYQAVLRDGSGTVKANQNATMVIDILQGSPSGTSLFNETHNVSTDAHGIVNLNIGEVEEGLSTIDWSAGDFYLKITVDGTEMGTSQMQWVPFALYANSSGDIDNNMPQVFTDSPKNITTTSAECSGNIVMRGDTEITQRGICWGEQQNPSIEDHISSEGSGMGFFSSAITNLERGTTYYARAYASNSYGTSYGNQVMFETTLNVLFPTVTTAAVINITANAAVSGGEVTSTGGDEITARGVCWSTNQNPSIADRKTEDGTSEGEFQSQISGLSPGKYYVRAYASNSAGTGYGNLVSFTTEKTLPTITTKKVISISGMGAVSGGVITSDGVGTISEKGICWSETENPTINENKMSAGTGTNPFLSAINLLMPNIKYYVRAYAINELGISYGEQKSFTTLDAFYDGFETGFSGTTGGWGIVMGSAVEGAYSLHTSISSSEASLTRTLLNSGQISFYARANHTSTRGPVVIRFYIDNVLQGSYQNSFWGLQSYPVSEGEHTFKWIYAQTNSIYSGNALIDFIVMPK